MPSPTTFLGVRGRHAFYRSARFAVLPVPYDKTATYLKGTAGGPAALVDASAQVELYDEVLGLETYRAGVATLPALDVRDLAPEAMTRAVERAYGKILDDGKIGIVIGGEHSVSLGAIRAARRRHPRLSVLQIDAHTDLRSRYHGTPFGHGCVMRRASEIVPVTQVGIRSLSAEESRLVNRGRVRTFFSLGAETGRLAGDIVETLTDEVYVTIDVDGLDPSIMPGTGTPEPFGLDWRSAVEILRRVAEERTVVGFDVVELLPIPGQAVSEFTAARLTYRFLGLIAKARGYAAPQGRHRRPRKGSSGPLRKSRRPSG